MGSRWFLFGSIKDYFWKLILGIGSIMTALELFTNKVDSIFDVNFKGAAYIFFFLYFLSPLILFLIWWWSKLNKSLPNNFTDKVIIKNAKVNKFFSIRNVTLYCIFFSTFIFLELEEYKSEFIFMIFLILLLGIIFMYVFYLWKNIPTLKNRTKEKEEFSEWLRLGKMHYVFIIGSIFLFWIVFFTASFSKNDNEKWESKNANITENVFYEKLNQLGNDSPFEKTTVYNYYQKVKLLKKLNKRINSKISSFKNDYWLDKFESANLLEVEYDTTRYNLFYKEINEHTRVKRLIKEFKYLSTKENLKFHFVLDPLKKIDEIKMNQKDSILLFKNSKIDVYGISHVFDSILIDFKEDTILAKNPLTKDWLEHFRVINNNMLVLNEQVLNKKLEAFRKKFRKTGLIIFAVFLFFLTTIWFHIYLENLIVYVNRNREKEWKDFSALSFINNYIILIIVLSVPMLTGTDGILTFDKPLWASPWETGLAVESISTKNPPIKVICPPCGKTTTTPTTPNPSLEIKINRIDSLVSDLSKDVPMYFRMRDANSKYFARYKGMTKEGTRIPYNNNSFMKKTKK